MRPSNNGVIQAEASARLQRLTEGKSQNASRYTPATDANVSLSRARSDERFRETIIEHQSE